MRRSAILLYHSIDSTGQLFSTSPQIFSLQLKAILDAGIPVIPLEQVQSTTGVALAFDDGHRNFLVHAAPLLMKYGFPATLFVVSGFCGRRIGWRASMRGFDAELLSWAELRDLANAGFSIGAHGVTHVRLPKLPDAKIQFELRQSRLEIEHHLGSPVDVFAYPYGHTDLHTQHLTAQQFRLACGTRLALIDQSSNCFDLPRIFEFYLRHPYCLASIDTNLGLTYVAMRRWISRVRSAIFGTQL